MLTTITRTVKIYDDGLRIDRVTVLTWSKARNTVENLSHYQLFGPDGRMVLLSAFASQTEAENHSEWLRLQ